MYDINEILETLEPVLNGEEILPIGTEVTFVKVVDNPKDLSAALVIVNYQDKTLIIKETNVRLKDKKKTKRAFKEFSKQSMRTDPSLRIYHHNIVMRHYYRAVHFPLAKVFTFIRGIFRSIYNAGK